MTAPPPPDADLLTPTLGERDDAAGFDRPWNPSTLVLLTFFLGLPAGCGLLAVNFKRLGMRERFVPAILATAATFVAILGVRAWLVTSDFMNIAEREDRSMLRLGTRAAAVVVALLLARPQRARYRLHVVSGLPAGGLWRAGIFAAVAGIAIEIGVRVVIAAALGTKVLF